MDRDALLQGILRLRLTWADLRASRERVYDRPVEAISIEGDSRWEVLVEIRHELAFASFMRDEPPLALNRSSLCSETVHWLCSLADQAFKDLVKESASAADAGDQDLADNIAQYSIRLEYFEAAVEEALRSDYPGLDYSFALPYRFPFTDETMGAWIDATEEP